MVAKRRRVGIDLVWRLGWGPSGRFWYFLSGKQGLDWNDREPQEGEKMSDRDRTGQTGIGWGFVFVLRWMAG